MAATLHQTEGVATHGGDHAQHLWDRLEAYVAHRWVAREVTWIICGGGEWKPPLTPAVIDKAYIWTGDDWEETTLAPAPIGFTVPEGRLKIEATVGANNTAPAAVKEAIQRLSDYVTAETIGAPGASSYSANVGQLSESISRHPAFMARALDNSGAADLLRPYKRA
ncbi:MAG: hypothetical protein L0H29_00230 [Sinobacteraceae bacterium]|nr:hypothetical protein [Nevskiaceae bacterium]